MLKQIIEATGLTPAFYAHLLGVPAQQFSEWLDHKSSFPRFVMPELAAVLGISEKNLLLLATNQRHANVDATPAVWFKLRDARLTDADREYVAMIRRLGFFAAQLDQLTGVHSSTVWEARRLAILKDLDKSLSPVAQGKEAAIRFRRLFGLDQGHTGVGEYLRPRLRKEGFTIIEAPIKNSSLEGCCFNLGKDDVTIPFVFSNTFQSTWFRRNDVILHEVCHALFDLDNDPISLDFTRQSQGVLEFAEVRASSFSRHCLVPPDVLRHYSSQLGLNWTRLSAANLAELMAKTHVEQGTLLTAAIEAGLINDELRATYQAVDCSSDLRAFSPHALSTGEFLAAQQYEEDPKWLAKNRTTVTGPTSLRLPVGYVSQVIEAVNQELISERKAAEMVMMDPGTFAERFGSLVHSADHFN